MANGWNQVHQAQQAHRFSRESSQAYNFSNGSLPNKPLPPRINGNHSIQDQHGKIAACIVPIEVKTNESQPGCIPYPMQGASRSPVHAETANGRSLTPATCQNPVDRLHQHGNFHAVHPLQWRLQGNCSLNEASKIQCKDFDPSHISCVLQGSSSNGCSVQSQCPDSLIGHNDKYNGAHKEDAAIHSALKLSDDSYANLDGLTSRDDLHNQRNNGIDCIKDMPWKELSISEPNNRDDILNLPGHGAYSRSIPDVTQQQTVIERAVPSAFYMLHDDTSNMISPTLISNRLPSAGFHDPSPEEREMLYRAAAMQPIIDTEVDSPNVVDADLEKVKPRRNVRISKDPQSVAARHRRQRISSKMRILQKLVPGGNKMDTASMLEEAAHYLKFLKAEVEKMEAIEQLIYARKGRQDFRMQSADFTSANIFQNLARPKNEHELSSSAATRSCTEGLQHPVFRNHNSALQVLPHNYIHHPSLSF